MKKNLNLEYKTKLDEKARQMYKCHGGNHRFSETRYSDLFGKQGSFKEYEMAAKMGCHGLSNEAIAEILDRDVRTIETWMQAIGKKSEIFHVFLCLTIQLNLLFLQMDELWSFLKHKKQQLWGFIALESQSKFWISFELGSRTTITANRLVKQIKRFGNWLPGGVLKVTTDKLAAYKNALAQQFTEIIYIYLQIVKRRFKRRLVTVKKEFVIGKSAAFPDGTQIEDKVF